MDRPKLSENARRLLEGRLRQLEEERIPLLKRELAESADSLIQAALRATTREVTVVRHALATATSLEDEPHVPSIGPGLHLPPASKLRKPRLRDAPAPALRVPTDVPAPGHSGRAERGTSTAPICVGGARIDRSTTGSPESREGSGELTEVGPRPTLARRRGGV